MNLEAFAKRLAAETPTPGGGAAAAYSGAMGAALIAKVARYTLTRQAKQPKRKPARLRELERIVRLSDRIAGRCLTAVRQDAQAYQGIVRAHQRRRSHLTPRETDESRVQLASIKACGIPLALCDDVYHGLEQCKQLSLYANPRLLSDLAVANALLKGSFDGAIGLIRDNLAAIRDRHFVAKANRLIQGLSRKSHQLWYQVAARCRVEV